MKEKQNHKNCFEVLINDMLALRDGGKSSNGVVKKTTHPEVGGAEFDAFMTYLQKLAEKARLASGRSVEKTFNQFNKMSDEDKKRFIEMMKSQMAAKKEETIEA